MLVSQTPIENIIRQGISQSKASCIKEIADQIVDGRFDLRRMAYLANEAVVDQL